MGLADCLREAFANETAVYPIGGGTSLDYGLPAKKQGVGVSLGKLSRVIDFPARDMTITVEAGITLKALAETLATEGQQFPVDVPHMERATLGGVVATNFNGPRRYGLGAVRDFVIGIHAVDGRGIPFKGGGRVVKNVAGYDFCKLLTGSLGTLGVITQITLKLKPIAERSLFLACAVADLVEVEKLLAALSRSETTPVAIELLTGADWGKESSLAKVVGTSANQGPSHILLVGIEGTNAEVAWMEKQLSDEWKTLGVANSIAIKDESAKTWWKKLAEFPSAGNAPLVIKASVVPSGVTRFVAAVQEIDPQATLQSHAGNGVVIARFSQFPASGLSRTVVAKLQTTARALNGYVVILSNPGGAEQTHQSVWGGSAPFELMTAVKKQFDPKDLLNPGRFVYLP